LSTKRLAAGRGKVAGEEERDVTCEEGSLSTEIKSGKGPSASPASENVMLRGRSVVPSLTVRRVGTE